MASNPEWLVVAQVDFNCWALSPRVVERMGMFDYSHNKLGWGTDWAALAFCFANRLLVVRDLAIKVDHPKSRSYDSSMAEEQMRLFLNQLRVEERSKFSLLKAKIAHNHMRQDLASERT